MNWTQAQVQAACRQYGPSLNVKNIVDSYEYPLDGVKLLWALSGEESTWGANCGPRFEPEYWNHPSPAQKPLNAEYGQAAAMSYGPWQVLYVNCVRFGTPGQIDGDINLSAQAAVSFINSYIIKAVRASNLPEIARAYNSGNIIEPMSIGVMEYVEKVCGYYENAPLSLSS
jgi:hypothetical protein